MRQVEGLLGHGEDCNENGALGLCETLEGASPDCNVNTVPDECELDCNGNGFPDGCCVESSECTDGNRCTFDPCSANICTNTPATHGDIVDNTMTCGPDGQVDLFDILAILDGFQSVFSPACKVSNVDIAGQLNACARDDVIDLSDIPAVLDAFQGTTTCCPAQ